MTFPARLLVFCFLAATASAQTTCMGGMAMSGSMDMQPVPAPETLPAPVRMSGLGNAHIAIKATPEAQVWFDQGLNLLHDFWDYEAAKAFEQAIRIDPQCAMCQWGLAQAEGFRGGSGRGVYGKKALDEAVRLKDQASPTDKLYIEAAKADAEKKDKKVVKIYRKLVEKQPGDLEARIYLAGSLGDGYDDKGEPKKEQREKIAILESVLHDAPNDSAANHYYIHALEPSNHPERAIPSAALLASLSPASGHMVHMPGHIYYRVGDYADADKWFAASTAVDEAYMHDQHVGPDDDWNYVHNMMYGIANLIEQGRLAEANALSDRLANARGKLSATLYVWSARDQMARLSNRLPVALRLGDWNAVLQLLDAANLSDTGKTTNLRFLKSELRDYATGMQALDTNDLPAAKAASDHMDAELKRVQTAASAKHEEKKQEKKDTPPMAMVMPDAEAGPLSASFAVASLELRAGILVAEARLDEAKKLYAEATKSEKALGYHEPPIYIRPIGETEATALLRAKDYAGATAAYQEALIERPNSGFGLYGLAHTRELQGDTAGARTAYAAFLNAWPGADPALPEVAHARQAIGTDLVTGRSRPATNGDVR